MYAVIIGSAEVPIFHTGIRKNSSGEVALIEYSASHIGFSKIDLLEAAVSEFGFRDLQTEKGGVVEQAILKLERKEKLVTGVEGEPQHFTVSEHYLPEAGIREFCRTEIAVFKLAFREIKTGEIHARKAAVSEQAIFIFPF